jgi:hypothetical protein
MSDFMISFIYDAMQSSVKVLHFRQLASTVA